MEDNMTNHPPQTLMYCCAQCAVFNSDTGEFFECMTPSCNCHRSITVKELFKKIDSLKKPMLDRTDPDNYEACFARYGFNDALERVKELFK